MATIFTESTLSIMEELAFMQSIDAYKDMQVKVEYRVTKDLEKDPVEKVLHYLMGLKRGFFKGEGIYLYALKGTLYLMKYTKKSTSPELGWQYLNVGKFDRSELVQTVAAISAIVGLFKLGDPEFGNKFIDELFQSTKDKEYIKSLMLNVKC